jgi:hypothetical protein
LVAALDDDECVPYRCTIGVQHSPEDALTRLQFDVAEVKHRSRDCLIGFDHFACIPGPMI